jgi:hypothetical protein
MRGADADLHDARLVGSGHADILENTIVDLTLLRRLRHRRRAAGDQRPEGRGLRLPGRVAVEGEVDAGVGEIGAAAGIGDPEFLDRDLAAISFSAALISAGSMSAFSAAAT